MHALAKHILEIGGRTERQFTFLRCLHHCSRQDVRRKLLNRGGEAQQNGLQTAHGAVSPDLRCFFFAMMLCDCFLIWYFILVIAL